MFVSKIDELKIEMLWQQRLGQFSIALKFFANQWKELSMVNFTFVALVNLMFIFFLEVDLNTRDIDFMREWQSIVAMWVGNMQTTIAGIVVISYYLEYRAILKLKVQESKQSKNIEVKEYGSKKGSVGYGSRKSNKLKIDAAADLMAGSLRTITDSNAFIKLIYTLWKEVFNFASSILQDGNHSRNIIYLWGSIYASFDSGKLFNALLMLDIISKIKTLGAVLSIFNENKIALGSTLALFFVLLYIASFISFQKF